MTSVGGPAGERASTSGVPGSSKAGRRGPVWRRRTASGTKRRRFPGSGAALAGVAFAILFLVGFALIDRLPSRGATTEDVVAFLSSPGATSMLFAGFYLVPFAGLCFIWFVAASRHRMTQLIHHENPMMATVQIVAAAVFVAMFFAAAAAGIAGVAAVKLADMPPQEVAAAYVQMSSLGQALLMVFGFRTAAVYIMVSTTRALRAGLFPTWLAIVSYAAVLLLLAVMSYARFVVLVVPLWVAATAIIVMVREVRHPKVHEA